MGVKCAPNNRGWEVSVCKMELSDEGKKVFQTDELVNSSSSIPPYLIRRLLC